MNCQKVAEVLQEDIKGFLGDKMAVIGISGGVDSAVVAYLCRNAVGKDKVMGIMMPYGEQSIADAQKVCKELGTSYRFYIRTIVDEFGHPFWDLNGGSDCMEKDKLVMGNIRARTRMILLYAFAGKYNGLVIGTSNKTELSVGYFTKYGDGGCDVELIGDLYKTEVFELAKYLGVPDSIINKPPSAELWEGQTDEGEFGLTYKELDGILEDLYLVSKGKITFKDMQCAHGVDKVNKVLKMKANSEHKRKMPITFSLEKFI